MANSDREKQLFLAALELPSSAERAAYLQGACGHDQDLHQRLQILLAMHEQSQGPLDQPPSGLELPPTRGQTAYEDLGGEFIGKQIGPYRLLEQIGEGGMGAVFLAEQREPVRRRVALKVIKPGMDSRQVIVRFEAERHALSMMDHPSIAKVLDAGTTDSGRPYFVMELVKGRPITNYCDQMRLSLRERLELFLPVCHAIQHAHQKGIIHRDIKPSNVLVAEYDGRPIAKVIDFGVAKAVHQPLTDKTMYTGLEQIIGTLEYMSPEQARVNQLDVDTRSDVYSLGVLLYELLTGSTPFDRRRLREAALEEVLRIIREEEPLRPSTKLSSSETLPSLAANRRTETARLSMLLRGELDWIVMKALDKDRDRRYETANGLALDVQRYLAGELVQACPPSVGYRWRKFARRNKVLLTTTTLVLTALLAGVVGTSWQAIMTARQRDRARQAEQRAILHFGIAVDVVDRMYDQLARRIENEPHLTEWQQEMLEAALGYYQMFSGIAADDPQLENRVVRALRRVGDIHRVQGNWREAAKAYEQAIQRCRALMVRGLLENLTEPAEILLVQAEVISRTADVLEAEAALSQAIATWNELRLEQPGVARVAQKLALALSVRGNARLQWGHYQSAEDDLRHAIHIVTDVLESLEPTLAPAEKIELLSVLCKLRTNRASNFVFLSRPREQEQEEREALKLAELLTVELPHKVDSRATLATVQSNLAATLLARDEQDESLGLLRDSVAGFDDLIREFPTRAPIRHQAAYAYGNLAIALRQRPEGAEETRQYHARALQARKQLVVEYPNDAEYQREYAHVLIASGGALFAEEKYVAASEAWQQGAEILEALVLRFPDDAGSRAGLVGHLMNLGVAHRRLNQLADSESAALRASEHGDWLVARFPENPKYAADAAMAYNALANALMQQGRGDETLRIRRQAVELLQSIPEEQAGLVLAPADRAMLLANLAHALHRQSEYREAIEVAKMAMAVDPAHGLSRGLLAELLANCPQADLREPVEALKVARPMLQIGGADHVYGSGICGVAHYRLCNWDAALPMLQSGSENAGDAAWETIVQFYLAATCHRMGELERARQVFRKALERSASLSAAGEDLELAREEARRLLDGACR